jgi:hypothetical protein
VSHYSLDMTVQSGKCEESFLVQWISKGPAGAGEKMSSMDMVWLLRRIRTRCGLHCAHGDCVDIGRVRRLAKCRLSSNSGFPRS